MEIKITAFLALIILVYSCSDKNEIENNPNNYLSIGSETYPISSAIMSQEESSGKYYFYIYSSGLSLTEITGSGRPRFNGSGLMFLITGYDLETIEFDDSYVFNGPGVSYGLEAETDPFGNLINYYTSLKNGNCQIKNENEIIFIGQTFGDDSVNLRYEGNIEYFFK